AERYAAADGQRVAAALLSLYAPPAARQVADHLAEELLGSDDLDGEDGLQQHRFGPPGRLFDGDRAGHLEGHLRGVDLVVFAVHQRDAQIDHRIARLDAVLERLLDALFHGRDVLRGNRAALDLVDELKALAGRRLEVQVDDPVLARATGLAYELAFDLLGRAAHGLAVGHLRTTDVGLHAELPSHAVNEHLEVQLAHARDLRLAGLFVGAHLKGGILFGQPPEGDRHLLLVGFGPGLDGDLDHRLREDDLLQ